MDGPSPGDQVVAPRIYMDRFLARFAGDGEIAWNPHRGKLWIANPVLYRY